MVYELPQELSAHYQRLNTCSKIQRLYYISFKTMKLYIKKKTMKLVLPQKVIPGNWTNEAPKYPFIHLSFKSTFVFSSFEYV